MFENAFSNAGIAFDKKDPRAVMIFVENIDV